MNKPITSGIRRRYLLLSLSILLVLTAAGTGAFLYMKHSQDELRVERERLYDKQVKLETLRDSLNDLFFRARGYIAFRDSEELNRVYEDLNEVEGALEELKGVRLNSKEQQMTEKLTEFLSTYQSDTLPTLIRFVEANDYAGLQNYYSSRDIVDSVNQFMEYVKQYKVDIDDDLEALSKEMIEQANEFTFVMVIFLFLLFVFIAYLIWRMMKDIVRPLEQMRQATDDFASGKSFSLLPVKRSDEIGVLFSSFGSMIRIIQEKEEELTAQNEELIMQQEELQEHQHKIEESLHETKQTKERLERYNDLNHVLSFTLNKQELADSILEYLDSTYELDLGMFWIRESGERALKGMTDALFEEFSTNRTDYIDQRLKEDAFFTVTREASHEKGLAADSVLVHDYFSGVHNPEGDMVALFGASRIGRAFSEKEQKELRGLLNRVALAIERIQLYDRNIKERILNERIINNINEGIQFVGHDGSMLQRNEAVCEIINCEVPLDETVERAQWIDHISNQTDDPDQMREFLEGCIDSGAHHVQEYRYRILEPAERVIEVYSAPVLVNEEKIGTILVHRDITREYEVDQMKTELVSTVSHELRTPLSSVLGFTELLLHKQLKPEKQKKYLETIYKEAKRLTNLINDFLDLQRMESGSQVYQMEPLQINELAVEAIARFRTESSHPLVVVDEAANVQVEGDKERLAQVLTNVLGNAIKFSPDGGHVTLTLSNDENNVMVAIQDEGIGIPAEDIPKLFNKFQRIDNSARRKIGGTGLGLAICREIIEKHNGTITIESEEGKGTIVRLSLPLLSTGRHRIARPEGNENSPSVMIVEDDMSLALLLSEELKMSGFTVVYHMKPSEAFEEAKRTPLVGIVIDLMLGDDLNGWDLVELLKKEEKTKDIPIIISSALDQAEGEGKLHQIDHYLTKPYPPTQLSKAVLGFLTEPIQQGVIFYPERGSDQDESK
ncbi:ATP-binding protein [Domibacillus sp. DTU_2020_1001157_1_SI_ALB_TIR_016]|uniref:ATP-binding protein n=1 Tax=Domibacillus sp. DTU_2020_1001157_1_SI_ALB_TIR_016 TaxID=3077789 RepID=UPI0028EDF093|nr:ATP-binding protein [Domibacillus sp. DTU_2020_1001157_1_SI_ALB_TIR_016]WNS81416.1 ATP-binding protein [Domibacillus sp. DTU_2020_1001157_1_SI_ALB_TIR_016]